MSDISDNESVVETHEAEHEAERKSRNRERNKEHARKTRMRKKEQLDALKARVQELEEEGRILKQRVEACNVASILIGLSTGEGDAASQNDQVESPAAASVASKPSFSEALSGGKRKRFLSIDGDDSYPPPMELNIKGHIVSVGGTGNNGTIQMNWKTGTYFDSDGKRQRLSETELKELRRERNRMHAKMTRDRKKCFLASLNRVIAKLEQENQELRDILINSGKDETSEEALHENKPVAAAPSALEVCSVGLQALSNSRVVNDEYGLVTNIKQEPSDNNKSVPQNLQESSAALMSISNSRIFTVG